MAIISFTNYKRGQTRGGMGAVMRYTVQNWKRGNISKEGCRKAKDYARDLLYDALRTADFTVEEFECKLESDNMYPACGVRRLKKSHGRPKTKGGDGT